MKKIYFALITVLLLAVGNVSAQTVEVSVKNQYLSGTDFYFDVYLKSNDGRFFLGYSDIILTNVIPAGAFSSPVITLEGSTTNFLDSAGAAADGYNISPVIGTGANSNRIIINIDIPAISNQSDFNAEAAKITTAEVRLGRFKITNATNKSFSPNHAFHTAGAGTKTKIYKMAASGNFTQSRMTETLNAFAAVVAANPTLLATLSGEPVSPTELKLKWTGGTADSVIIFARPLGYTVVGTDTMPSDGLLYTPNTTFGSGATIGGHDSIFAVYRGLRNASDSVNITGLTAGRVYVFTAAVYNGESGYSNNYSATMLTYVSSSFAAEPSWRITNLALTTNTSTPDDAIDITYTYNYANVGDSVLVYIRLNATPTTPSDGKKYNRSLTYASGDTIGAGLTYAIYADTVGGVSGQKTITVSGLNAATTYQVSATSFRGTSTAGSQNYRSDSIANAFRSTTYQEPTVIATGFSNPNTTSTKTDTSLTLSWTNPADTTGNTNGGDWRIVVAREAGAPTAAPVNGAQYSSNRVYGAGSEIGTGNYVVYQGAAGPVTILGLKQNQRYYFDIYEFNGDTTANDAYAGLNRYRTATKLSGNTYTWLTVTAQAWLAGAWNGTNMTAALTLPAQQPYNNVDSFGYVHNRVTNVGAAPANAVDWVLVQLRRSTAAPTAAGMSTIDTTMPAFIRTDGTIVDTAGNKLVMPTSSEGNFYLVLYHRNHLPVISADSATIGITASTGKSWSFKSSASSAVGTDPLEDLTGGVYALWGGNADATGATPWTIDASDRTKIWANRNTTGVGFYRWADTNMDGTDIQSSDLAISWNSRAKAAPAIISTP